MDFFPCTHVMCNSMTRYQSGIPLHTVFHTFTDIVVNYLVYEKESHLYPRNNGGNILFEYYIICYIKALNINIFHIILLKYDLKCSGV
jgi:hypothetical protein